MCGCATRSVAPKRGAAGAGPADGRASAATASWAAPPLGIFRVAPHVLHEQRVRLRWPSNAISRLCGSNNRRYGAVPNAQIVILACPTHGRSAVPTSSNRGSRLRCSCDVAPALHATMSLGAAGAVRARSADRAGRLPSMLWLERRSWRASPWTELTRCSRHEPLRRAFARANKLLATMLRVRSCRRVVAETMTVQI